MNLIPCPIWNTPAHQEGNVIHSPRAGGAYTLELDNPITQDQPILTNWLVDQRRAHPEYPPLVTEVTLQDSLRKVPSQLSHRVMRLLKHLADVVPMGEWHQVYLPSPHDESYEAWQHFGPLMAHAGCEEVRNIRELRLIGNHLQKIGLIEFSVLPDSKDNSEVGKLDFLVTVSGHALAPLGLPAGAQHLT